MSDTFDSENTRIATSQCPKSKLTSGLFVHLDHFNNKHTSMASRQAIGAARRYATVAAESAASATTSTGYVSAHPGRVYSERKAFLYSHYTEMLRESQMVLIFKHDNLSVKQLASIRLAIAKIQTPESARFTITRAGVLAPAVRATHADLALEELLQGQTALITCPSLSPKYISDILKAIEKIIKSSQKDEVKGQVVKQPSLDLIGGVVENRLFQPEAIRQVAALPEIDTLRAQLVGLLEMSGRQLVGVLSQAAGGSLVRTLQGLEEGLKEKEA